MENQMDDLMLRVLVYVDRNGTVVSKDSSPNSASLQMKYKDQDYDIKMHAYANGMNNGSCGATVKYQHTVVFDAGGSYTSGPWGVKAKTYTPGKWEKKFPKVEGQ